MFDKENQQIYQLSKTNLKKSLIRETKNLLTDADSSHNTKKNPAFKAQFAKKLTFFCAAILHPLWAKVFKPETTPFHYFSPKILTSKKKVRALDFGKWGQKDV